MFVLLDSIFSKAIFSPSGNIYDWRRTAFLFLSCYGKETPPLRSPKRQTQFLNFSGVFAWNVDYINAVNLRCEKQHDSFVNKQSNDDLTMLVHVVYLLPSSTPFDNKVS